MTPNLEPSRAGPDGGPALLLCARVGPPLTNAGGQRRIFER
jgi:hypothetical protein